MIGEVSTLLTRHQPGYEIRSVARLDERIDNAVYVVNGQLIVRARKAPIPAAEASRPCARRTCWPR